MQSLKVMWENLLVRAKAAGRDVENAETKYMGELTARVHALEEKLGLIAAEPAPAPVAQVVDPAPAPVPAAPPTAQIADPAPAPEPAAPIADASANALRHA